MQAALDPTQFILDYEKIFEVLLTIVIFSFFIERALTVIFETRWFINFYEKDIKRKGIKELFALITSIFVCYFWQFDALSIILVTHTEIQIPGIVITGAVIAGGSKASIKLFHDMLGFMSNAEKERQEAKKNIKQGDNEL